MGEYVEIEQEILFELILAANYLDIKPLLDLTCAKVASMIKGKTPEEIRKQFNIVNDFTPEEEAQVREENKWCEMHRQHSCIFRDGQSSVDGISLRNRTVWGRRGGFFPLPALLCLEETSVVSWK